jgi:carbonic anhydrase/acetyltransferase-like protein (isoleucine patch superfamily)
LQLIAQGLHNRGRGNIDAALDLPNGSSMEKPLLRRATNRVLHLCCRFLPGSTSLRPFLHRARGVKISGRVFIGDDVYIDGEYPECVELHDGVQLGPRCMILAHTRGTGARVVIEKNAFIGANCVIIASRDRMLTIGEAAVLTASSLVMTDVPPFTLMGAEGIKPLARITTPLTENTTYAEFVSGLRPLLEKDRKGDRERLQM